MWRLEKGAVLLLVLNVFLYAQAASVLKKKDVHETSLSASLTEKLNSECKCGANQDCLLKANNEPDCSCISGYVEKVENKVITCLECNCHETQICFVNDEGNVDCRCASGQIEKIDDEGVKSCLYCNCPISHECFVNARGFADCRCPDGKVEKVENGVKTCLTCYCPHEHECFLDESGKTACRCPKGKIEQNIHGFRSCVHCYCHETQECFLNEAGSVDCRCPTGYIEKMENGVKTCIECDCGAYGICNFVDEEKKCTCAPSMAELDGKCVECDCGLDGLCRFESGQKKCVCRPKTIERDGKCVAIETSTLVTTHSSSLMTTILTSTAFPCYCGPNSKSCAYNWDDEKICECFPGYAVKEDYCFECNCGPYGSCKFVNDRKKCSCAPFTVEMNGVCVDVATISTESTTDLIVMSTMASPTIRDVSTTSSKGTTDSISTSTMISTASTERDCSCGHSTKTCRYNMLDEKECTCYSGYAVNQDYCEECDCGPYGSCIFENGRKRCNCKPPTVEKRGFCVVIESTTTGMSTTRIPTTPLPTTRSCYCGENSKSCTYNWYNEKICECFPGYAVKKDYCFECNCGPYGSCSFEYGRKRCDCKPSTIEKDGVCVVIEPTTTEKATTRMPTTLPPTTRACSCGENSKSCAFNWYDEKICECFPGYAVKEDYCFECNCGPQGSCKFENDRKKCSCAPFTVEINGVCVDLGTTPSKGTTDFISTSTMASSTTRECDCGINARSCFYRRNGHKVCNCDFGYIQNNGYCSAICNEEKCVHGKCEIIGNGFKCRCNEGFTGPRCADKIQTISNKLNLWMAMQFTVTFAIFLLLSGMFCFMGRLLNRSSKK